jgi:hypothetical protein
MSLRFAVILIFAAVAAFGDSGITCVEFLDPAEVQNNILIWTPEREQKAKPIPLELPTDKEQFRAMDSLFSSQLGTMDTVFSSERLSRLFSLQSANAITAAARPSTSVVQRVPLFAPPFNAIGRLLVLDNASGERACTAFFVGDPSIVMTAAHCVFNRATGKFFSSIFFKRVHTSSGGEPFGITKVAIVDEWKTSLTPHDFDFAFLRVAAPLSSPTRPLAFATSGPFRDWIAVGYPNDPAANPNFDGQTMLRAPGTLGTAPSPNMIRMDGNPMGQGLSGGPFLPPAAPPQNAFGTNLISVASLKLSSTTVDGPILGQRTTDLFANVKDVRGDCKK